MRVDVKVDSSLDLENLSDLALLTDLFGESVAAQTYSGSLDTYLSQHEALRVKFAVARELVWRWLNEELGAKQVLSTPENVKSFLQLHFAKQEHESFVVLFLDAQMRLIGFEDMFRGTLTQTSVYPREVVKAALQRNAASVMLAHNHPSGLPEPSRADEALTQTLKTALSLIDVRVLDHFIVARAKVVSFAERGLM